MMVKKKRKRIEEVSTDVAPKVTTDVAPRKLKKKKRRAPDVASAQTSVAQTPVDVAVAPTRKKKKKRPIAGADGGALKTSPVPVVEEQPSKKLKHKRWLKKMEAKAQAAANAGEQPLEPSASSEPLRKKKKKSRLEADSGSGPEAIARKDTKRPVAAVDDSSDEDVGALQGQQQSHQQTSASSSNWGYDPPRDDTNFRKVFVGGIPFACLEEDVRADFEECGEIEAFVCLKDETGRFKGMAFITFKTKEGVDAALAFNDTDYGGRNLKVAMATPRGQDAKGAGKDAKGKDSKGGKGKDGKGKDGGKGGKPGDWTCPGCGINVFASKDTCFKCGEGRPGGAGGGKDKGKGKSKDKGKGKGKDKGSGKGKSKPRSFGFEMGSDSE